MQHRVLIDEFNQSIFCGEFSVAPAAAVGTKRKALSAEEKSEKKAKVEDEYLNFDWKELFEAGAV